MATIRKFEDLEIWQSSRNLCKIIFSFTKRSPFSIDFKLVNQINDSSGSVMDNIAEGFDRGSRKEFIQFLGFAKGSSGECKSQLYRALDREYISQVEFESTYSLTDEIGSKINGLINYLNSTDIKGNRYKNRVEEKQAIYGMFQFDLDD